MIPNPMQPGLRALNPWRLAARRQHVLHVVVRALAWGMVIGPLSLGACGEKSTPQRAAGDSQRLGIGVPPDSTQLVPPGLPPPPVTFAGDMPCADCPGIRTTLTLLPDSTYLMRRVYREATPEGDAVAIEPGRWSIDAHGPELVLRSGPQSTQRFTIASTHALELLDAEGHPIDSQVGHQLVQSSFDPVEDSFRMHGMVVILADAGRFRECLSRRDVAIAQEGDNAALEHAYGMVRQQRRPDAAEPVPLMAALVGHFAERSRPDGSQQAALIVDRFETIIPSATCGHIDDAPLNGTTWKVLDVEGNPMPLFENQRQAQLALGEDGTVTGQGPCNQLRGGYTLAPPAALSFSALASTSMACPAGMDEESALLAALTDTRHYRLAGETLELQAEDGHTLVRLVAVYF